MACRRAATMVRKAPVVTQGQETLKLDRRSANADVDLLECATFACDVSSWGFRWRSRALLTAVMMDDVILMYDSQV